MLKKVYSGQPFYTDVFKITEKVGEKRSYGSGVLLAGGQDVLTTAHLFSDNRQSDILECYDFKCRRSKYWHSGRNLYSSTVA
ncbi:hypothetical protein LBMAG43_15660 [Methylococcaceae bacterium]|nr:hypothetical protein LBMAG43_15660 [Methylococcaceae bacterium]